MYRSSDLFKLYDPHEESIKKIYHKLALNYHPDKNCDISPDVMKLVTENYRLYCDGENHFMDFYPVFISVYNTSAFNKIPVIIKANLDDIKKELSRASGIAIGAIIGWTGEIRPWGQITLILNSEPVKEKNIKQTDIECLRTKYLPDFMNKVKIEMLFAAFEEFLVLGKQALKSYLVKETGDAKIKLGPDYQVNIKTGKNLSGRDLTFAKFCYLLGEVNRDFSKSGKGYRLPGFTKYIKPTNKLPREFALYLHHGIQFSWDLEDINKPVNKLVFLAIQALETIFVNINRLQTNLPLISNASKLDIVPSEKKTWNDDLMKYIGMDRYKEFFAKNKIWIKECLLNIEFIPGDLKITGSEEYL